MIAAKTVDALLCKIDNLLTGPALILFLGTAIIINIKTKFPQLRNFRKFLSLLSNGITKDKDKHKKLINPLHALFSSMAATVGMGNIVGPAMAISLGGPGALLWLLMYIFLSSATKFAEVCFAVHSRNTTENGDVIGGPSQYLKMISPKLGSWYAFLTIFLFTIWSSIQVNTLSSIWKQEGIANWTSGALVCGLLLLIVLGGVRRIGFFASRVVPIKFIFYIIFALIILISKSSELLPAIKSVFEHAFNPKALFYGIMSINIINCIKEGIFKGIFITESGIGTASISHAMANTEKPTDQGIIAMYSSIADIILCSLSGLLALVTGVWKSSEINNTLIYQAFKNHSPLPQSQWVLVISVLLFALTALIGNTFNGAQSFASLTKFRFVRSYYLVATLIAFSGAFFKPSIIWKLMEIVLLLVAIPNLIGLIILVFRYPKITKT